MRGIIFIAPPAAGKGTQSDLIKEKYNFLHISTGDLLREEANDNSYIAEKLENGELVDDNLISELLEKKLSNINSNFILDGYPRDINQAVMLNNMLGKLNVSKLYIIYINIDRKTASRRILGRLQCPNCKEVYNSLIDNLKPIIYNTCDDCHIPLEKRTDDNEETFNERFDSYIEKTKPLINYYKNMNLLYTIDGTKDKNELFKDIEKILGSENYD